MEKINAGMFSVRKSDNNEKYAITKLNLNIKEGEIWFVSNDLNESIVIANLLNRAYRDGLNSTGKGL